LLEASRRVNPPPPSTPRTPAHMQGPFSLPANHQHIQPRCRAPPDAHQHRPPPPPPRVRAGSSRCCYPAHCPYDPPPPTHRPSSHHGLRPGSPCRPAPRLRRQPSRRRQHGVCSGLQADCPGSMVRRQGQWAARGEPLYRTHKDTLTRARARPPHPPVLPPSHACLPSSHTSLYPIHRSIHASLPPHAPTCAGQLAQPATTRVAAESTDGMGLPRPETML